MSTKNYEEYESKLKLNIGCVVGCRDGCWLTGWISCWLTN